MFASRPAGTRRRGVTLPEAQLLVLLLAVVGGSLAALIWGDDATDQWFAARHNLFKLRRLVEQYRDDHQGRPPADFATCCSRPISRAFPRVGFRLPLVFRSSRTCVHCQRIR